MTEELQFRSELDGSRPIDIFAFFSYPVGAHRLPAFIWNQGGLVRADPRPTEQGAKRGFATLAIDFPMPGYRSTGAYPIVDGLEFGPDARQAPIAHGAVALLRAVSYLESRAEVDPSRIGMAGSSWGGFFTTLMAGLDHRLKAAAAMFGSGALELGNPWWDGKGWNAARDAAFRASWAGTLDPALRLATSDTPIAWFTGTNDQFYWMPSVMASYQRARGPKALALLPSFNHALTPALDEQALAWLEAQLTGGPGFVSVSPLKLESRAGQREARWSFGRERAVVSAELAISPGDAGNWPGRCWGSVPAKIDADTAWAALPQSGIPYFVFGTVVDGAGFRYSTPLVRIDPKAHGLDVGGSVPACDGAAPWGRFDAAAVAYLKLHGLPVPAIASDAGHPVAALHAGRNLLGPLFFVEGRPERLRLRMKAAAPVQVTVAIDGALDGRPVRAEGELTVGREWGEAILDLPPQRGLAGHLSAVVTTPAASQVLCALVAFSAAAGPSERPR